MVGIELLQVPVVQKVGNTIQWINQWINQYPLDSATGFSYTHSLDSDLSGGERYAAFDQAGPDVVE